MTLFQRARQLLGFPSKRGEIAQEINRETVRLKEAVECLSREVVVARKHRQEMAKMLDETLQALERKPHR